MANPYDDVVNSWQQEKGTAAAPVSANPYDSVVGAMQEERQQTVRSVFEKALATNPDQAAENKRLADTTGLSFEMVERNKDEIQRKQQARMLDLARMAQDSPVLARQLIDPTFTKQTHDHLDNLSALEQTFNVARALPAGAATGMGSAISGLGVGIDVAARATGLTAVSKAVRDLTGADLGVVMDVAGSLKFVGGGWKMLGDAIGPAPENKNFMTDVSGGIGQLMQQIGVQIATGGTASLVSLFAQGADATNEKVKGDNGSQALKDTAIIAGASITALTEKYGVDALLNRVPPAIKNSALRWVADKLAAAGIEATQEIAEGVLQDTVRVLLTNNEAKIGENVAYEAGVAGTSAAIVRAALGVRVRSNADMQQQRVAEADAARLQEQFSLASGALLRDRNPEQFRALVQSMADQTDGAPSEVYIDAEVLNQMAPEVLDQLPGVAEQMADALAANGVVSIQMGDVLAMAPGTPLEAMLVEHARIGDVTAMSQFEAKEAGAKAQEFLAQESQRVIAQAVDQQAMQESSDRVKQGVLDQLNTVGRFRKDVNEGYATWTAAFYTTMAGRLGVTPEQMAQQYPLRITGQSGQGATLKAGKVGEIAVEGFHFSKADRSVVSTSMYGTGLQGSNRELFKNAKDKRLGKRAYFYADTGTGINPEAGVGGRGHKAQLTNVYDSNTDPLRLKGGSQEDFESKVLDAGFNGYLDRMTGTQSGQVIMLGDQNINVESLGGLGKTSGARVAPAGTREAKGRDVVVDALNTNTALPAGSPTLARWQQLLAKDPDTLQALTDAGVFAGDQNENVYKSELVKRFIQATPAESYAQSLSSRLPSAVKATEDPLANVLNITFDVVLSDTKTLAKNVKALQALPNMRKLTGKGAKDPVKNVEAFIDHVTNNLLWLHDHMPAEMRDRARQWYDGGRKTIEAWGKRYGISEMQGAAAIAVLSPQNGWFANVSQGERIADMVFGLRDFAWDDAMTVEATRISSEDGLDPRMQAAVGKTLGELLATPDIAARWARVYDQTYNNRAYRVLTPEGGAADYVKTGAGNDATMMWKSYSTIAKSISVLVDGRAENVYYQIGKEHKVRNFYNNLFAPKSDLGYATIDTHAVAAALLRPLASADIEVEQAFGGGGSASSNMTGLNGTYPIYLEAYRRAAEARGILPREMQSITWEAVRGLFEAAKKSGLKKPANAIWERYKAGEIEQEQAQKEILALAGDITPPSWTSVPFNDTPSRTYEGPAQKAIDAKGDVGAADTPSAKVMFEVAPDPNDEALTAEWNALDSAERLALSQQVAARIVPQVLKELGTDGDFVMQLGGYLGATNPSMTLRLARPELTLTAAKLLGHALSQDSMMVVTERQTLGAEPVGAVTITLPDGYGETEVSALYDKLWELEQDSQKLIGGHTTADGQMVILNYSGLDDAELARLVDEQLGGEFPVAIDTVYSAFPSKEDYGYGSNGQEGAAPTGQSPAQRRPSGLRSEATQLLREALDTRRADTAARAAEAGQLNQDTQLLAPNGKPSNLTPAQHALVRTPEFKAWFGDWEAFAGVEGGVWSDTTNSVSKAVDENGEPLVVYHGTDKGGFTEFNKPGGNRRGDLGIFLSSNREMARSYVKKGRGQDLAREDLNGNTSFFGSKSGIYPLFVNIRNPNETDFEGANWDGQRREQYEVTDESGDQVYAADGRGYLSEDEANTLAENTPGATVDPAGDHYESTDSVVREARASNDGAIIRNVMDDGGGNSSYTGEPSDVFVALDPTQVKSVDNFGTFNPNDANILKQGPRGTFSPASLELALNENADLSTFLHETGHFFLEVMADVSSQPNAPADIQQDMAALMQWFGVADLATWNSYTLDQKRPYHERFAESFEQYLMEGKAPSLELQPLFRKFRAWMLNVYKSLKAFVDGRAGATEIQLSDEIRQVFDRMIASEEQITQANEVAGLLPNEDADAEAVEKLTARSLRDLKWTVNARAKAIKALQKQAAELRKGVEAEVRAEVEAQPIYRAMQWLRKGEMTDEAGNLVKAEKGFRLATEVLGEMFPETMLGRPDLTRLKGMTLKGGLHPDLVADMVGFESGDALVRNLIDAEPLTSVVEGITDQRMLETHGDLIDQRAIEAAANEAVHNEARARSLATELRSQAEMLNPRTDTGEVNAKGSKITVNAIVEAAKQFAADVVSRTPLRDLKAKAWQHTAAERRAGKRWKEHTAKGETQDAVKAKQDQVLNNAAAKAAIDAQTEMRKILTFFKRVIKDNNEKTVDKGRDPDVVNAARAILGAYGVAPKGAKTAAEYMDLVAKNDPAMFAALQPSVQGALNMAQPLDALTMDELRGLHEEIQAMWHLAKRSRQMEVDGNLMDMQDAEDELQSRMQSIGVPLTIPGESSAITPREKASRALQFAGSLLRRAEQWAEGMGSEFTKLVFQPVKDAANAYRADRVVYRKAYQTLVDNVAPALVKGPIAAPELGYTFGLGHNGIGHAELLHAILHTGNTSNKRKLLLGRGWATENADGTMDTSKWDAFLTRMHDTGILNKAHYDFAQGVWDLLEQTKPLAQKTHRDVFGRYFAEVTADSFTTPFGDYAGGYVPAQADPRIVQDAALRDLATSENENMAFSFPGTNKGFTKGRVEYNRPLMLDLRTIGQHIDKVLLFSHMEPAVRDVNKLLSRKGVSYSLGRIDPTIYAGMLTPWLNRSARQIVETPIVGDGGISRVLSAARNRAGMALMFANVSNAIQQTTGFLTAMSKLKSDGLESHMTRATVQFIKSPKQTAKAVGDASPFMATRMENEIAAINDAMDQILLDPSLYEKAQAWTQKHAYFLQSALANSMEPIIWTAGYNAALEKGLDEKEAVRYADGLIRQTQGSTLPEDVSRLETGPAYARVFTQFIGYFNMMANTNATALKQIAAEMGLKKGAGKAIGIVTLGMLAPIWMAEAIAQAMRGGPDDEDKDGYLDDWLMAVFGMGTLKGTLAMVPFVGQLGNAAINRFNGNPADDKMSLSPAVSLLEAAVGVPVDVYKAITDPDKLNKRNAVRDVASLVSIATGLPAVAVARPLGYLAGVEQGRIDPTSAGDMARGLVTGTPSPASK